ncbi:LmeA family phospholipid-binding protein [Glycomyces tenuis]|uniref:LmeA family phospholipid-binding protein n=1 Tax=Glycomyces tenuis TaxID=58116 RepID=UPI00040FAB43|nr:DUF2993 domain-containing protein [Glycomyces tenuis]
MGKILRRLLIALVIIVALVALGDRVANAMAERRVATEVADTASEHGAYSERRPDVTIHGWPFVTQAWSGDFEQIDIELREVGAEGLVFPTLDMVARDVAADWRDIAAGNAEITASEVDVSGTVSIASLEELLREQTGYDLVVNEDGSASVSTVIDALGMEIEVVGTGAIEIDQDELRYVPDTIESLTGDLPPEAQSYVEEIRERMSTVIELPELPWGLQLTEIAIEGDTVSISGSAADVPLT